ncbi:MAG TPA: polyphosphate kinase 2 family protein [Thermoanaerobaculia bacterium]|jgi:PPK2 family polyphosphate:nucleotide phosphotransferase|nr:polyphosphate kinase 2 family protein [Thermoanaerobaculia bacterium]
MKRYRVKPGDRLDLGDIDPGETSEARGDKEETLAESAKLQKKLEALQEVLFAEHKQKVLIVLQGMDTSGKDGATRFLMGGFNSQGVQIVSFKKPTEIELDHDFLWRIHPHAPGRGNIALFNRSHYEDVLVVRVHELVPEDVWRKRYEQIRAFEELLASEGTTILKFFLHISRDEQRERLQARIDDPKKRWKFAHGDLEERKLWKDYQRAYEDALAKTSTRDAPWYIVPADRKWYRNYVIGSIVVETLEGLRMEYPQPEIGDVVIE